MNKHGETSGFVFIVIAFIAIVVGLAFWPTISPNVGQMTRTFTSTNVTMTLPAAGATSELTMCGQRVITSTLHNATNTSALVPTSNYTITQSQGTDGYLAAKVTGTAGSYVGTSVNVSCNYEPKGYIAESSGRAMVVLVTIFLAMLIAISALPNVRDKFFDFIRS